MNSRSLTALRCGKGSVKKKKKNKRIARIRDGLRNYLGEHYEGVLRLTAACKSTGYSFDLASFRTGSESSRQGTQAAPRTTPGSTGTTEVENATQEIRLARPGGVGVVCSRCGLRIGYYEYMRSTPRSSRREFRSAQLYRNPLTGPSCVLVSH